MKPEQTDREQKIQETFDKLKVLSDLTTWAVDNYSDSPFFGLLSQNLKAASDQVLKINLELSCPAELTKLPLTTNT